jgi:hypothetical protein
MTARILAPLGLALVMLGLAACDSGRQAPLDTTVRVINAAPGHPTLEFRRERTEPQPLELGGTFDFTFDEDTYDFFVDADNYASNTKETVHEFAQQVLAGTTYVFVLAESAGAVTHATLEYAPLAASAAETQIIGLHAAEGLPAVDVHIAPAGSNVTGAVPWATPGFLQPLATKTVAAGDYEITITEAGNSANVLFTSQSFPLAAARTTTFVIAGEGGRGNAPFSVIAIQDSSAVLVDRNAQASVRAINGATDLQPRDVAVAGVFAPPLLSSVVFAEPSPYALTAPGTDLALNVTPPGNPGVLELDQKITLSGTRLYTVLFAGDAGALTHMVTADDGRRYADRAIFRFYNAARQFESVAIFLVPPGTDLSTVLPDAVMTAPAITAYLSKAPGEYEIVVLQNGTGATLAGPIPVTLAAGGSYGALVTNGADTATVNVTLVDDFP